MSDKNSVVIRIGGAAGDGIASAGDIVAKTAARMGLHVFAYNSYQSVIRGGHVYYQLRLGTSKVLSHGDEPDVLVALNQDSIKRHAAKVKENGAIVYNSDKIKVENIPLRKNVQLIALPVNDLTKEFGRTPIMQNTVDTGALIHILGLDWDTYVGSIRSIFGAKKAEIGETNIKVATAGLAYAKTAAKPLDFNLKGDGNKRAIVTGNAMFAFGALAGGCKFYAAYPMTPASSIMHWLAPRAGKFGTVMKQMEDEIAAMNAIVGVGQTGARAVTGTSGGGFALMTEGIGLSAMLEVPTVVIEVMRGGPSTGLPTKTEQADLFQLIGAGQGDYPKAILAPKTVADCYKTVQDAMNLAEKYQTPILVVSDLYLSEHAESISDGEISNKVEIERGEIVTEWGPSDPAKTKKDVWFVPKNEGDYLRYKATPSGVSPRALPGTENTLYCSASDEHDEEGITISDVYTDEEIRIKMMEKRMRKMNGIEKDTEGPEVIGPKNADISLVGWGSNYQIIEEARAVLEAQGKSVNHIHFKTMWPLHAAETTELLKKCKKTIDIECNYTGQLARLVRMETGISFDHLVRKYDGEPFTRESLLKGIDDCLEGKASSKPPELVGAR